MRKLLLATTAFIALAAVTPANAAVLNVDPLQVLVSQSLSNPCIICGTNVQQPAGFGFNNYVAQGNQTALTLYSTNVTGALGDGVQGAFLNNYTASQLTGFFGNNLTFGVAIDVNAGNPNLGPMVLESFQLIDLGLVGVGDETILAQTSGPVAIQDIQNGNGFADYIITGFNLAGVQPGDRLVFRAQFSNMSDGPDSFYLVAQPAVAAVPELSTWLMMIIGFAGIGGLAYRKHNGEASFRVA
jgi:hypothetical protein